MERPCSRQAGGETGNGQCSPEVGDGGRRERGSPMLPSGGGGGETMHGLPALPQAGRDVFVTGEGLPVKGR